MNHEFLADQAVLNKGISLPTYQHILLAFSSPDNYQDASESPLANAINYSFTHRATSVIKKRFTVMKTHTTKQKIWLRSLVLLPLLALTLYGFSEKKEVAKFSVTQNVSSDTIQAILIYIDEYNTISLNGNPVKFEDLETEINNLNPNLTPQQKQVFLDATIQYVKPDSLGLIKTIGSILLKCKVNSYSTTNINTLKNKGLSSQVFKNKYAGKTVDEANAIYENETINLSPPKPNDPNSPWQVEVAVSAVTIVETDEVQTVATPEMIEEYNSIAKSINSKPLENRIVKSKDFNRLSEIYSYMSEEQKQVSEPLPSLPKYDIIDNTQQKATSEEVAEYNKLARHYNEQSDYSYVLKLKDMKRVGEIYKKMDQSQKVDAEPLPNFPPPPPPIPSNPESKIIQKIAPPPSINLTTEQKKTYMETLNNSIAGQTYTYKNVTKDGKDGHVVVVLNNDDMAPSANLKQSDNFRLYLLERDKTFELLKNPAEYPSSFLEMSDVDQRIFQEQYMKMYKTFSKLTELEKNSAPKILPPAPDPKLYTLKNGKIVKKNQ